MKHAAALLRSASFVSLLSLVGALGCNALMPSVSRRVDGVTTDGRFIDPDAYALYALAALREARGQSSEALALYQRALDVDGRGPEVRTRIGAVACKLHRDKLADRAFAAAARAALDYGPLWFELAQCRKARGNVANALRAALEAVRLDPERFDASLLAADLAELGGNPALAWQLRDGLATHAPNAPDVQRGILAAARRNRDPARTARTEAALARLDARSGATQVSVGIARALEELGHGDLTRAKREAEQLLGADPSNADALVVALAVADLEQDHASFNALLDGSNEPGLPASPEVLSTLGAVLGRRVSAQAEQLVHPHP